MTLIKSPPIMQDSSQEITDLKHDIERYVQASSDLATELADARAQIANLEAELNNVKNSERAG